jgi:RNA polymerase sigma-70 factor (ECF subfamily)
MISNCDYVIKWLETGRRPGNRRGVERLAAYQREVPTDIIERFMKPPEPVKFESELDWQRLEYILSMLTDRERDCYERHIGSMYSEREIAEMLGISRASVREFIARAERKIKQYKNRPIPLSLAI